MKCLTIILLLSLAGCVSPQTMGAAGAPADVGGLADSVKITGDGEDQAISPPTGPTASPGSTAAEGSDGTTPSSWAWKTSSGSSTPFGGVFGIDTRVADGGDFAEPKADSAILQRCLQVTSVYNRTILYFGTKQRVLGGDEEPEPVLVAADSEIKPELFVILINPPRVRGIPYYEGLQVRAVFVPEGAEFVEGDYQDALVSLVRDGVNVVFTPLGARRGSFYFYANELCRPLLKRSFDFHEGSWVKVQDRPNIIWGILNRDLFLEFKNDPNVTFLGRVEITTGD